MLKDRVAQAYDIIKHLDVDSQNRLIDGLEKKFRQEQKNFAEKLEELKVKNRGTDADEEEED